MKLDSSANTLLRSVGKPPFIYGTAWKKDSTTSLVRQALDAGYTAIDTANQPRHYREDLVGEALRGAFAAGSTRREDIFLQTKFSPPSAQDANTIPYDPSHPLSQQITNSLTSTFNNLRPTADLTSAADTYLDCVLLHSPLATDALTLEAWRVLETYVPSRIRALGISNCSPATLRTLWAAAKVKPAVVQNRFYARTRYDAELRAFCREHGIVFQSFWTLSGNIKGLLVSEPVLRLSREAAVSKEVALYALVMELEIAVLNGTTDEKHMKDDLKDVSNVRNWTFVYGEKWKEITEQFKEIVEPATT